MQKKKIIALGVALSMSISVLLTGCGGEKGNNSSTESDKQSSSAGTQESNVTPSSVEEELSPVTLTYWVGQEKTEDSDKVQDAVNDYLADVLPNTTVEFVWVPLSEYSEKWSKAMAAQESIDLAWQAHNWMSNIHDEIRMGSLTAMDDLFAEYGQGILDTLGQKTIDRFEELFDGLYFVPAWQGMATGRVGLYLPAENVALMDDGWMEKFQASFYESCSSIPVVDGYEKRIETLSYFEDYLKTSKENDMLGLGMNPFGFKIIDRILTCDLGVMGNGNRQQGYASFLSGDTYKVFKTNTMNGEYAKVYEACHDFYEKGYIREDVLSAENVGTDYASPGINYITYVHNAYTNSFLLQEEARSGKDLELIYTSPSMYLKPTSGSESGLVIPATAKNPERAMMFMNLLYSDANLYRMIVHGVEGSHYTQNADGTITVPEGVTYTGPYNWMLGTCANSYQTDFATINYYSDLKEIEETAIVFADYDGFQFNTEKVAVEVSNLKALAKEYELVYVYDDWENRLADWFKAMEAAGCDKVFDEYVTQLTAYAETKGRTVEVIDLDAK